MRGRSAVDMVYSQLYYFLIILIKLHCFSRKFSKNSVKSTRALYSTKDTDSELITFTENTRKHKIRERIDRLQPL